MQQINFEFFGTVGREFGGSLLKGKRKTARPLSTTKPMHLILKSNLGNYFIDRKVEQIIISHAKEAGIKIHRLTMNWSHAHLTIYFKNREFYYKFIRTVTAAIVRYLSQKLGKDLKGIFELRPYTKILSWGRQMKNMENYHEINEMESFGMFTRKDKFKKYKNKESKSRRCSL